MWPIKNVLAEQLMREIVVITIQNPNIVTVTSLFSVEVCEGNATHKHTVGSVDFKEGSLNQIVEIALLIHKRHHSYVAQTYLKGSMGPTPICDVVICNAILGNEKQLQIWGCQALTWQIFHALSPSKADPKIIFKINRRKEV